MFSKDKSDERRKFTIRLRYFVIFNFILIFLIITRLLYLQRYNHTKYKLLSDKNRIVVQRCLVPRGEIVDEQNRLLATNQYAYSVTCDLYDLTDKERNSMFENLNNLPIDAKAKTALSKLPRKINKRERCIVLQENVNYDTLTKYCVLSNLYPNISIDKSVSRYYPYSVEVAHFIGYTGSPSEADVKDSLNSALRLPLAKTGKCGIEKTYEELLFGKIGIKKLEVNSRRQPVRTISEHPGEIGKKIELTINIDLQKAIYEILSEQISGSCIVMDIETGAILALVSYPGYDINIFSKQIPSKLLNEIYANPAKPIINKAVSGLYAPGSTFKVITALAGLHYGVIDAHTRFHCSGYCALGNHKFYCWRWKYGGHGSLTVQEALEQSCDCFFYNLSRRLNPDQIAKVANDFGLGVHTRIDIPNERSGLIPTKAWKQTKKKQKWTMGDSYNMSIGQGYVLTTPLQLARMVAIFSNNLRPVVPHLYKKFQLDEDIKPLKYDEKHIQIILDGMYDVVNSSRGTAHRSAINDPDFEFAGKTGSSQVKRISNARRAQGKTVFEDYESKDHALFIAFAPADYPKYAVSVVIEHGGGGASVAAPIARDVLLATRKILTK